MVSFRINKKVFYAIVITAILTLALSTVAFKYFSEIQKNEEIEEYKKAMYSSILCQHKCPLVPQVINNITVDVPETECVKECTTNFRNMQISKKSFNNEDLLKDNLFSDLAITLDSCKANSFDNSTLTYNNSVYFSCSLEKMESLKMNYTYLQ